VRSTNPTARVALIGVSFALAIALPIAARPAFAVPPETSASSVRDATSASASASSSASASGSAALLAKSLPSPMSETNTCAGCHGTLSDPKLSAPPKDYLRSVHKDPRIGCVGCHKGDPRDPTVGAHSRPMGFDPHPTHAEVPQICGGCHSDAAFILRLNDRLTLGQAALYGLSLHGKLSASGDVDAPNCASCHGKHDIQPPSSPTSPVNRANVANLCKDCHADERRMSKYGLRVDQYDKWKGSVHGEAFAAGNPRAPTCTGCHGPHAPVPPDSSAADTACARCHEDVKQLFEQSPHSKSFRSRGLGQCVACHGNHDVARASAVMVGTGPDAVCMKCHANDDKPSKIAVELAEMLRGAQERAQGARNAVARATSAGLAVPGASYALERLSTAESKVRSAVHTLDPARLRVMVAQVDAPIADALNSVSTAEKARKTELRGYRVTLGFAGLLLATLLAKA
jgi:Cytochrome c3/Doubled CXXCH motif (Paired_CXXCH_1)